MILQMIIKQYEWMYLFWSKNCLKHRAHNNNEQARAIYQVLWLPKTHFLFTPHHVSFVGRCKFVAIYNVDTVFSNGAANLLPRVLTLFFDFHFVRLPFLPFVMLYQIYVRYLWYISRLGDPLNSLGLFIFMVLVG